MHELRFRNPLHGSWVNPNASCPVCGADVYFYQSESGGKVFFDELGPPWPKHLCTDHSSSDERPKRHGVGNTRWPLNGWKAIADFQVTLIAAGGVYKIKGISDGEERSLLFRFDGSFEVEIARFRKWHDDVVDFSMLARDPRTHEWMVCDGIAKVAPSYAPEKSLVVSHRIPDVAPDEVVLNAPSAASPTPQHCVGIAAESRKFYLDRIDQIDDRIRALLAELGLLNSEKSSLIRVMTDPSDQGQR